MTVGEATDNSIEEVPFRVHAAGASLRRRFGPIAGVFHMVGRAESATPWPELELCCHFLR
jgi:hypothetical protein